MSEPTVQQHAPHLAPTIRLWHEARTALDVIMGFAELLLLEVAKPNPAVSRQQVEGVLRAGRRVLWLTNQALPESVFDVTPQDDAKWREALQEPQRQIIQAAEAILQDPAVTSNHPQLAADVRRIRDAAARLLSPPTPAVAEAEGEEQVTDPAAHRLLVVGTSSTRRDALDRALTRHGYRVEWVAGEQAVVHRLEAERYHLVILSNDVSDAEAIVSAVRARSDIPVLVVAPGRDATGIARTLALGVDDYVTEPLDPAVVRLRVAHSLERHRLRNREMRYMSKLDRIVDAARALLKGEYKTGQLQDAADPSGRLQAIVQAFEKMAAKTAVEQHQAKAQWGQASVFIDADQVKALQAEIEAARKKRGQSSKDS